MSKITKVISTQEDAEIRRLIKVLGLGTDDVQEVLQAAPYGDDSNPIENMVSVMSETNDSGESVIIGYINKNQISDVGEKRIFSTDANGNVVMSLHLKNDGTAEFGGNADNLIRFNNTKLVLDELKGDITTLKNALSTWIPVINDGGAALKASLTSYFSAPLTENINPSKIDEIKTL